MHEARVDLRHGQGPLAPEAREVAALLFRDLHGHRTHPTTLQVVEIVGQALRERGFRRGAVILINGRALERLPLADRGVAVSASRAFADDAPGAVADAAPPDSPSLVEGLGSPRHGSPFVASLKAVSACWLTRTCFPKRWCV